MTRLRRAAVWTIAMALVAIPLVTVPLGASPALATGVPADVAEQTEPGVTHEQNPSVPVGAAWTEEYFASSVPSSNGDPVMLHADVLRPADLAPGERTPVIMSIGPYFSHSGMNEDTHPEHTGPSSRFTDLIDGGQLMERRYSFVYVDLRGFGASTGCFDWLGAGEQADVTTAVEWAAQQPWSTGAVGLYGKSYDATTGLAGIGLQPEGLDAVVAQEPVWNPYDYLVTNGVSRPQQTLTPDAYISIADLPGVDRSYHQDGYDIPADTETYLESAAYEKTHPECAATIKVETQENDRASDFWQTRDLPAHVDGSAIPLMFTQGLTEQNTKPEDMQRFLDAHSGEVRAWIGPWDHVRGNETDAQGTLEMGRSTWFSEVMDFYDDHLKSQTSTVSSYAYVQDNFGVWRAVDDWGTTDKTVTVPLQTGSYLDVGQGGGDDGGDDPDPTPPNPLAADDGDDVEEPPAAADDSPGLLTATEPVRARVRLTGTPSVEVHTQGSGNVSVLLWDMAPDRSSVLIDSSVSTLSADGVTYFELPALDWTLETGHSLVVDLGTIDSGIWMPHPSGSTVVVTAASLALAVESPAGDVRTDGDRAPFLDRYLRFSARHSPMPDVAPSFVLSAAIGRIAAEATTVAPGDRIAVTGSGYDPGAPVVLSWQDGVATATETDAAGAFTVSLTVPSDASAGTATVTALAEDGGLATLDVTVVSGSVPVPAADGSTTRPAALAATGASADAVAFGAPVAVLTLLAGASLLALRRRRRAS